MGFNSVLGPIRVAITAFSIISIWLVLENVVQPKDAIVFGYDNGLSTAAKDSHGEEEGSSAVDPDKGGSRKR